MPEDPDTTLEDAIRFAQQTMQRCEKLEQRVSQLEQDRNELRGEVSALKLRFSERDEQRSYDDMTTEERVGAVRESLFRRGEANGGKATMDYNDIMWSVFDGEPSADYCYKLMRLAGETPGFTYYDGSTGTKHVEVKNELAKTQLAFSSANNASAERGEL